MFEAYPKIRNRFHRPSTGSFLKKFLLTIVALTLSLALFANSRGGFIPDPPKEIYQINDRIRNTPAVDPDLQGSTRRFYITTFGLEAADTPDISTTAPLPITASLIRFGIVNQLPEDPGSWGVQDLIINRMDEDIFNQPDTTPINCYNDDDWNIMSGSDYYDTIIEFSDDESHPEAFMRYGSGTGFWASPVLYKFNNQKNLLLLNKSGCLMSLRITGASISVNWKVDLREEERTNDCSSAAYEFMATPVIVDGKAYIAGIKMIHVVNLNNPESRSLYYPSMEQDDYFDKPIVFDTFSTTQNFYLISHLGAIYNLRGGTVYSMGSTLGRSDCQPILDSDGHVYFYTRNEDNLELHILEQNLRKLGDYNSSIRSTVLYNANGTGCSPVTSSVLTDFSKNQYLLTHDRVLKIKEPYNFTNLIPPADPVDYGNNFDEFDVVNINGGGTRFPSNHAILSYHNSTSQTMILTLSNSNSLNYLSDVRNYYPNSQELYSVAGRNMNVSYMRFDNSLASIAYPSPYVHTDVQQFSSGQTWGGIAPYRATINQHQYLNTLFGDECGRIFSYKTCVGSALVGYNALYEEGENDIPEMGYTKFMKNLNNVPSNEEINNVDIYISGLQSNEDDYVYLNAYARNISPCDSTVFGNNAGMAAFTGLLPNKHYRVSFYDNNDNENPFYVFHHIEIKEGVNEICLNSVPDLVISQGSEYTSTWTHSMPLVYNSVTIEENAHWIIDRSSNIVVSSIVRMGTGAEISIRDGATLTTADLECNSTDEYANIDVDGTDHSGKLIIKRKLTNSYGSKLRFKGYNIQALTYDLRGTLDNGSEAELEFFSAQTNPYLMDTRSAELTTVMNNGTLRINDCVKLKGSYNYNPQGDQEHVGGHILIHDENTLQEYMPVFGHLIWEPSDGKMHSDLQIGHSGITPELAKLTIQDNTNNVPSICEFKYSTNRNIYGTLEIKDRSKCIVTSNAIVNFHKGSVLKLEGNLEHNKGAEFIVTGTSNYPGVVKLDRGVNIIGLKPKLDETIIHGDRIVVETLGRIEGFDPDNPRALRNLNIETSHTDGARWDGIYINTEYGGDQSFELHSEPGYKISGINIISIKYPGAAPNYQGLTFKNCTYGIYQIALDEQNVNVKIQNCKFQDYLYGVYLEGDSESAPFTAEINNCEYGNNDQSSGNSFAGIALRRVDLADIKGSSFNNNGYGILSLESAIKVGVGETTPPYGSDPESSCSFGYNEKAGIFIEHSLSTPSLIYQNNFSTTNQNSDLGIGVWINDSIVDVRNNTFENLGGHGMLLKNYSWDANNRSEGYHGFAHNIFIDNKGCELIGDAASLTNTRGGTNEFGDLSYIDTGYIPSDPSSGFESWDKYILAIMPSSIHEPYPYSVNMSGNIFLQYPFENRDRFYPEFECFEFDDPTQNSLNEMILTGVEQFHQGRFAASIQTMKQIVENYPDAPETKLAIDFLYLATKASTQDYASLRAYLDLNIPLESLATYIKKEEAKTQCLIKEENYIDAISRLQFIIDNPETVADSLFALMDQAYCYMNLADSGAKALPAVSVKTVDFPSYMEFLAGLMSQNTSFFQSSPTTPKKLSIDSNYPNPFNPETSISFTVPNEGVVKLCVYNIKGQKVAELLNQHVSAGKHTVFWNGTNSHGREVSSGLYFAKVQFGKSFKTRKMMLLK